MQRSSDRDFNSASGSGPAVFAKARLGLGRVGQRRVGRWVARALLGGVPLVAAASACLDRPIGSPPPVTTNIFVDKIVQTSVDKIDLLFMIDNSISMSDKQDILRAAVPDLVNRLVNPICVDTNGNQFPPPAAGQTACPTGQTQEFNPIKNINIGIVSSSLGDVGANSACPAQGAGNTSNYRADSVDMAHLIGSLPRGADAKANAQGFLEWRAGTTQLTDFNTQFQQMVKDVGEKGCGWEASMESWYRFLVDPFPYRSLVRVQCPGSNQPGLNCVQPETDQNQRIVLDQTVLDQRAAFLRPDSLVAVIMLTDENDCSLQVGNQTWVVANIEGKQPMFRGSSACDQDPNSKCCYSCPLSPPDGCAADPICAADPTTGADANRLPPYLDGKNLRCFQQKKRFGVDFLYPTQRYVNALTQYNLCWNTPDLSTDGCDAANVRPNPLLTATRQQSLVFLGGIIGVPWQTIASTVDSNGRPLTDKTQLRFQDYAELTTKNTWAQILGSPGVQWQPARNGKAEVAAVPATPPSLPQMVEATAPRPNVAVGNDLNGREYDTTQGAVAPGTTPTADDLQYACIFPLQPPRDCTKRNPATDACDCYQGTLDRPLCEQTPGQSTAGTTQYWAKAYPGLRELQVLKDFGQVSTNSIVASICARNVADTNAPDYGYRPAIAAIVDRLKEQLGNRCLPRSLTVQADGTVPCTLVETTPQPDSACTCDPKFARQVPSTQVDSVVRAQLAAERGQLCGPSDPSCQKACLCEVQQVQQVAGIADPAAALNTCRQDSDAAGVEGWCYIDADQNLGNKELVANCPDTEKRLLRFVGRGLAPNTTTFVACTGSSFAARE